MNLSNKNESNSESLSVKAEKESKKGTGCAVMFFAVFGLAGSAFMYFMVIAPLMNLSDSSDWVETPCVITSSQVHVNRDSDGDTYRIDIHYKYKVFNKQYEGERYNFVVGSSSGKKAKQKVVNQYPVGKKTMCFVKPEDPTQSVIKREFFSGGFSDLLYLLPLIFVFIGFGGIIIVLWPRKTKSVTAISENSSSIQISYDSEITKYVRPEPTGPLTLKSKNTPLKMLLALLFFALFWNGIVSIFLMEVIEGWRKGDADWFLTLFFIPFGLVGIGLIGGVFYSLLGMFNPKAVLTIEESVIPLGSNVQLLWQIDGNAGRFNKLKLSLIGQESVTYRRGTNTVTDKTTFHNQTLFESFDSAEMTGGTIDFVIPLNTMHTWEANNNKIFWQLIIEGDIPNWPDMKSEFDIKIVPS